MQTGVSVLTRDTTPSEKSISVDSTRGASRRTTKLLSMDNEQIARLDVKRLGRIEKASAHNQNDVA